MKTFEIYFSDLTEDAKARYKDCMNESIEESNYDIFPIVVMEVEN